MIKISKKILTTCIILFAFIFLINVNDYVYATNENEEVTVKGIFNKSKVEEVLRIVNERRAENGVAPLSWDYDLERIAVLRASEIKYKFSHTKPNGKSCFTTDEDLGMVTRFYTSGENIAYGYGSAESVMTGWMNSKGHRQNILSESYNAIGVAVLGDYWVQYFGHTNDNINTNKFITSDNQEMIQKINLGSPLEVYPYYTGIECDIGEVMDVRQFFYVTNSYHTVKIPLADVLETKIYSDSPNVEIKDNAYASINDYGIYYITAEVKGNAQRLEFVVKHPDATRYMFDYNYYANKYPDLKSAFGYNEQELYNHWQNFGIREGRQASPVFDPKYYLENNADLKNAFGNDYNMALNHFLNFGINEKRNSSPEYCCEYYRTHNSDLEKFSSYRLLEHYYIFGYKEGRKASENEVQRPAPIPTQPSSDWNGNVENILFDSKFYGTIYRDLNGMDPQALYNHWKIFGIKEGRQASIVFDPRYYLNNNIDLKNTFGNDYQKAYEHYITFGIREGRKCSQYFNARYYLENNGDLQNVFGKNNFARSTEHFVIFGIKEGRAGSQEFNVKTYRNNYSDLNNVYGNSYSDYYIHYNMFGKNEGRSGI